MFFSRYEGGEKVVLVQLNDKRQQGFGSYSEKDMEFLELAKSSGACILEHLVINIDKFDAAYLISSGKRDDIGDVIVRTGAQLAILNLPLTSTQERNLEKHWQCRVIDRVGLILDIFAQRARTFEGKLQVELAQLEHLRTRLVRGWTHLERQKGGIGLRGPGESQLETDRRLIQIRIDNLKRRLAKVKKQRQNNRNRRQKQEIPIVAIVGYTNAGKSSLFNSLTNSQVYAEDKLFATLDTTLRKLNLGANLEVILADTVGFIKDLPHQLIESFSATLEEATQADAILHVIDAADWNRATNILAVEKVLEELGIIDIPIIRVFNKIDLLSYDTEKNLLDQLQIDDKNTICVWTSVKNNWGLDKLKQAIRNILGMQICTGSLKLDYSGKGVQLRARLYALDVVKEEFLCDGSPILNISLNLNDFKRLLNELNISLNELEWFTKAKII